MLNHTKRLLHRALTANEADLIHAFAQLPDARVWPVPGELPAVYVPAQRRRHVLLVAHTDTVWDGSAERLRWTGAACRSADPGRGLGADDRAGIAALWALRHTGHALLLVPAEERGCIGAQAVADEHADTLADACAMIELDRRGGHDVVIYDDDARPLQRWLTDRLGYVAASGSFSDVAVLGPATGVAGANLSIGYRREHTADETLDVLDWLRTVTGLRRLLHRRWPRFTVERGVLDRWDSAWWSDPTPEDSDTVYWCAGCDAVWEPDSVIADDDGCPRCAMCGQPIEAVEPWAV